MPNSGGAFFYGFAIQFFGASSSFIDIIFPENFANDWSLFPNLKLKIFYTAPNITTAATS